jgi:dolichol kinase
MLHPEVVPALAVAAAILVLFAAGEALNRGLGIAAVHTRKVAHVGAGLIVLSFPWLFAHHETVAALAVAFFLVLAGSKALGWLGSVHAVPRKTRGAFYYPVAVYLTFLAADGVPLLYVVPVLVLACSDALAEVVGTRWGRLQYQVLGQRRSLAGSSAFFASAFVIAFAGLCVATRFDAGEALLGALVLASCVTAVEAVSIGGGDNLTIPIATWLVLTHLVAADTALLGAWAAGALAMAAFAAVLVWRRRVTAAGAMAGVMVGVLAMLTGGLPWLTPLLVFYVVLVPTLGGASQPPLDLERALAALLVTLALVVAHALSGLQSLYYPFLASIGVNLAMALSAAAARGRGPAAATALMAVLGAALPLAPAWLAAGALPMPGATQAGLVVVGGLAGALMYRLLRRALPFRAVVHLMSVVGGTATAWSAF